MSEHLTEEELGRIASDHIQLPNGFCPACQVPFPCLIAKLYQLVIRQSTLLAEWGLPCACHPDFDLPPHP